MIKTLRDNSINLEFITDDESRVSLTARMDGVVLSVGNEYALLSDADIIELTEWFHRRVPKCPIRS